MENLLLKQKYFSCFFPVVLRALCRQPYIAPEIRREDHRLVFVLQISGQIIAIDTKCMNFEKFISFFQKHGMYCKLRTTFEQANKVGRR